MSQPPPNVLAVLDARSEEISMSLERIALGCAIRRLRQARGLTIDDLSSSAGIHATYLSGIERGVRNPSWGKLCDLADALDISLGALADEVEEEVVVSRIAQAARARLKARSTGLDAHAAKDQLLRWHDA